MNLGMNLNEMVAELDRRASAKHDVVQDANMIALHINDDEDRLRLNVYGDSSYKINDIAHRQLASITKIPQAYYDRLRESDSAMVAGNVNHWLGKSGARHTVRTIDGTARAVLSDRYLRIENESVAEAVLPLLYGIDDAVPLAMDITDKRMYMKFLFEKSVIEVRDGDTMKVGVTVTNSEVGHGQYVVKVFLYRDYCANGLHYGGRDMGLEYARRHLGSKVDVGVQEVFTAETVRKNHEAIVSATTDIIKAVSSPEQVKVVHEALKRTTAGETLNSTHIPKGIEVLGKEYGLTTAERTQMLGNLIDDNDFSRWGVINSITKIANDLDFDRAHELENIGGKLIDLSLERWNRQVKVINEMPLAA